MGLAVEAVLHEVIDHVPHLVPLHVCQPQLEEDPRLGDLVVRSNRLKFIPR